MQCLGYVLRYDVHGHGGKRKTLTRLSSCAGACAGAAVLFDSWEARRHHRPDSRQTQGERQGNDQHQQQRDTEERHWEGQGGEQQVLVLEGRPLVPEVPSGWRPSEGQVAELQESVRSQADAIREMKTAQGLKNQVRAAVARQTRVCELRNARQACRVVFAPQPCAV